MTENQVRRSRGASDHSNARASDYERNALEQIHQWKKPEQGWFGQTMQQVGWPVERLRSMLGTAADAVGLADVFAKALAGIVTVLANVASFAVRQEADLRGVPKGRT